MRILEKLDGVLSGLVPILYLLGLALGTAAYFTGVTRDFGLAVGALACAAECHLFLQQRRVRRRLGDLSRASEQHPRRPQLARAFWGHVAVLLFLVAFSTYNSVAFVAKVWTPIPGWLPGWVQTDVRGAIIPALFLLTGLLAPLDADAGELLVAASHGMLTRTLRATVRQWTGRIERARRRGVDLAPIAVALMVDTGDLDGARRVGLIAEGLAAAEATSGRLTTPLALHGRPPDDGGTPSAGSNPADLGADSAAGIVLLADHRRRAGGSKRPRSIHGRTDAQVEAAIRRYLVEHPAASVKAIMKDVRVSLATASKWRRVVRAELSQATVEKVAR
jgi:hypothetical protein